MSAESTSLQIPPNITRIAGPLILGYLFNWGLFGALSVQVYNYHVSFPNDRRTAKAVVYGVYLVELSQTIIGYDHSAFLIRICLVITVLLLIVPYGYPFNLPPCTPGNSLRTELVPVLFVRLCSSGLAHPARLHFASYATGFGNFSAVVSMQTIWLSAPISIGLVGCIVQLYYAYRVYVLSGSRFLVGIISACSLFQFAGAIAQGVQAHRIGTLAELADKAYLTLSMWLAGSATCDVLITVSMAFLLFRKDTRFSATHTIIVRLMRLVIETGVLTATAAIVDLILLLAFPNDNFHSAVTFVLAKLYSNSLLVLFNNRTQLQHGGVHNINFDTSVLPANARDGNARGMAVPARGIHVQRMTFVDADGVPMEEQNSKKPRSFDELDLVA